MCTCVMDAFVVITGGEAVENLDEDSHVRCLRGQSKVVTTVVGDVEPVMF